MHFQKCFMGSLTVFQSELVGKLFQNLRGLISCAAACTKPSDSAFMAMLGPLQSDIEAVNVIKDKYNKERDLRNHLATLSEGVPAVGWVTLVRIALFKDDICTQSIFFVFVLVTKTSSLC